MTFPIRDAGRDGPAGHTYAAVLLRPAGDVPAALREIRFSGRLAPPETGWQIAVVPSGAGTAAARRRGVAGVGEHLAGRLATTVLAVRVLADRQLFLGMWSGSEEIGRYVSDPSREPDASREVLSDPYGAEHADAFAVACERPDAAADLGEILAEELDPDSVIESERLSRVLRLLGMPTWLVAVPALPRDIPTGPRRADLIRLGAGLPGAAGWIPGWATGIVRRRRPPPPVITDPPSARFDPWLS